MLRRQRLKFLFKNHLNSSEVFSENIISTTNLQHKTMYQKVAKFLQFEATTVILVKKTIYLYIYI